MLITETTPITETNNFIILDKYTPIEQNGSYQTENDLERELIADLQNQGYEYLRDLNSQAKLLANVREQLQKLNNVQFSDSEWGRFVAEYLDKPSETLIDKTRKIHHDHIYDFVFDNGQIRNIYLVDKKQIARNSVQVINQFEQSGTHTNRYDVTILVNGLPLVQIELKKRGVAIREAFNQIHRYTKESFNTENSLFKFLQIFVISNGTDTRYFANTTQRNKNSFDFTMNWAKSDNTLIKDLKDFTATFLQKRTLLNVLFHYSVFDVSETLLIMRPYQIAATERILWKINSSYLARNWSNKESGGYIWHTTGSGKTLTSFKAARLATELEFIDKVFFVVDRKDLDYQTMKEYQRFSPDSVNGSESTAGLKRNLEKDDNKIIVTTIQKLNNLMKSEEKLPVYQQQVVFIFDECHRSQFGEAQRNLKKKFKKFYQFGFTGTPIFPENALGAETTAGVFGRELHSYIITDAIRDEKVLKFKVDYNDVRPKFKAFETEKNPEKLTALETKEALLHPERIKEISQYVLTHFKQKTHRLNGTGKGFNAMFAVSSVAAAKLYYDCFKLLQQAVEKPLKIATIFSFAANQEQDAIGDIADESFDPMNMQNPSDKAFLQSAINDYNAYFQTNYGVESREFQNYYRDLAKRVKNQEIDLLIVVGMFLTGFDAPTLNTLFVDKNLRYHGLIQAYSRTNRIFDTTKTFGNIVTFRDLEQATIDALQLFGKSNTRNIVLERSYQDYMQGYVDQTTGESKRGYIEVVKELQRCFPDPQKIETEQDKKAFVKLFGEYLRLENILQNYDEFHQPLSSPADDNVIAEPAAPYGFQDLSERATQDYRSTYNDIRDWLRKQHQGDKTDKQTLDWSDVVFEVDLLKSQEINLDYILELVFEHHQKHQNKPALIEEARRMIRASVGNRAKESLIVDFIHQTDLNRIPSKADIIEAFFLFAQGEMKKEADALIHSEQLNEPAAQRYLATSLKRQYASENGSDLNELLPKMSPLNPKFLTLKNNIFQKISAFVEKFKGVGGKL
ncbi:type I restriction endonuclease subunit R [Rodentibacter haemolyticus]|uniref:Type I restriction enzyme endonuclease subunit n=1 Tax=Rodentibacter haemolyticus TaxID=2778911 RepID=A0ABX6UWE6_9PAST|nr:type I restriction endonuclease subunit R [Rodentibacter haemolyticus]QPB42425.1 type I restriction endonuclease subunit R [Rodentibacter haemolyticus]